MTGILAPHRETVKSEWVDYNGHLNEAYYLLIFSHASDDFMDHIGMHANFRESSGYTLYTLETHLRYLREIHVGEPLSVNLRLVDYDAKRVHLFQDMHHETSGDLLATAEILMLCVKQDDGPGAATFPPDMSAKLEALHAEQLNVPPPKGMGKSVGIKRKKS